MDKRERIKGKWYVVDCMARSDDCIVSGPFDTRAAAEADRVQLNIADDCIVARAK